MGGVICPFKAGDHVVYRPSDCGYRYELGRPATKHLVPGELYEVAEVRQGEWVILRGFEDRRDGGWYWTEFKAVSPTGTLVR